VIRKALLVGASTVLVLALAACGAPHQGVVHDKRYSEGYYYTTYICSAYNSNGTCSVQVPIQNWADPSWSLDIYNGDDHGWAYVSQSFYDSVKVGDDVNLDKDK
jgi:hypothetical protein